MTFLGLWPLIEKYTKKNVDDKKEVVLSDLSKKDDDDSNYEFKGEFLRNPNLFSSIVDCEEVIFIRFTASWCKPCKAIEQNFISLVISKNIKSVYKIYILYQYLT